MQLDFSLLETLSIPYILIDSQDTIIGLSSFWQEQLNLNSYQNKSVHDFFPNLSEAITVNANLSRNGTACETEILNVISDDGSSIFYSLKVSLFPSDLSESLVLLVIEDVTDSQIERELIQRSQEVAKIGAWRLDFITDTIYWSAMTKKIHGVSKDYQPDLENAILFYKEGWSRDAISMMVSESISSGLPYESELIIVTASGEEKWVRVIGEPEIVDGKCVRVTGIFQDINTHKQTEIGLERSEQSIKDALENSMIGMAIVAKDGSFLTVNKSLCQLLDYTASSMEKLRFFNIAHEDDVEKIDTLQQEIENGHRDTYQVGARFYSSNGDLLDTVMTATCIRTISGEILHYFIQIVDISNQVNTERKLRELLSVTKGQNESLMNFAYIVSHNLRSHASNLTLLSELVLNKELNEEEHLIALSNLSVAAAGLDETIGYLNEVVQINVEGNNTLKPISLKRIVERVLVELRPSIVQYNIQVNLEIPKMDKAMGNVAYLESIVLNLLSNAIKYRRRHLKTTITVKVYREHDRICMDVIDNGLGIDLSKYGDKIFGMYKTFHGNPDAKGIGLFISKNQIEALGGRIYVKSEVGKGSCFTVVLSAPN